MNREEIIDVLQDDKLVDYIQPWLLEYTTNIINMKNKVNKKMRYE